MTARPGQHLDHQNGVEPGVRLVVRAVLPRGGDAGQDRTDTGIEPGNQVGREPRPALSIEEQRETAGTAAQASAVWCCGYNRPMFSAR
ncbi:hypothetical protein OG890_00135 [Streptomyces anulatus]|uniref:hypothetical protein n=1 Tax=Streptomyces anulatus TaxID=1892 RepID=UPI0022556D15|nr:hypothetical protein [Streptomyces anulatus]MCX4482368.1 hypothetical protein [Streptomyces anulatus]